MFLHLCEWRQAYLYGRFNATHKVGAARSGAFTLPQEVEIRVGKIPLNLQGSDIKKEEL